MCSKQKLFGRKKIPSLPFAAYDFIFPIELELSRPLPFQSENVNLAVACMQHYLKLRDTWDFYHCIVSATAFPSFLTAMETERSRILPFSCWCDRGITEEASHHRHMIIASSGSDRPKENLNFIAKTIESPMKLMNTMGYVSKRESQCDGTFYDWETYCESPTVHHHDNNSKNHYWIFTPLPTNFRLPVALQWDGGILQLIHQEYRCFKPLNRLLRAPVQKIRRQFKIAIKDLPDIRFFLTLPVARNVRPVRIEGEPTDYFVCLNRGQKLYFDKLPEALDDRALGQVQVDVSNLLLDAIGEELWTPNTFQQKCLQAIDPWKQEIATLRNRLAEKNNGTLLGKKFMQDVKK